MTHGQNDQRFNDFLKEAGELARTHAEGGRSLAILYGRLIQQAAYGVVDTQKDKHGKGIDDAALVYDHYAKNYVKKAGAGQTADSIKAQKSKMRLPIKLGEMTTIGDPTHQLDRFVQEYKRQAELDNKSVRPESAALLAWAKMQLDNSDQPLSDDMIAECVAKTQKEDPTAEEYFEAVRKRIEKAINGEAGFKTDDPRVLAAHEQLRSFITTLCVQREQAELLAKAAELGMVLTQEAAE